MSKLSKLASDPSLFIRDMAKKRFPVLYASALQYEQKIPEVFASLASISRVADETASAAGDNLSRPKTYLFGFSPWKQFMTAWFSDREMIFLDKNITPEDFKSQWEKRILSSHEAEIMIWGFKSPKFLMRFVEQNHIPLRYVEDGFIRSVQLGATKAPPFSLSIDSRTPYFNAREASDLEVLLSSYDFAGDPDLLERSRKLMHRLIETGISKYNQSCPVDIHEVYGKKESRRILVIGQVEDDASIEYGCDRRYTNNDLVMMAYLENPDSQIIYKPHPDVLHGKRPMQSNPNDVRHICQVLDQDIPLSQSFETIDHVYTITSQAGFEALQRGISVTTLGCPFYSGWGLTDDRQPNVRRNRQLSVEEVFAGAYLLYLRYFDPIYKKEITAEEAVDQLVKLRELEHKRDSFLPEHVEPAKKLTWMIGFDMEGEHRHLIGLFQDRQLRFLPTHPDEINNSLMLEIQASLATADLMVWTAAYGYAYQHWLHSLSPVNVLYIDQAPIAPYLDKSRYMGFTVDTHGSYLNAAVSSDLECLLNQYDVSMATPEVARKLKQHWWPMPTRARQAK
ncbi:MAG: hypothetical protein VXW65_09810, partial [Pseudomonadota bacterium]|nr:hypothetical protein [Pseudomonadota bacterium]